MKIQKLHIFLTLFVLLGLGYSATWFYTAHQINKKIFQFFAAEAPAMGIKFLGPLPTIKGFPGPFNISYIYGIKTEKYVLTFGKLEIEGFLIPGTEMSLKMSDYFYFANNETEKSLRLNNISTKFIVPKKFPKGLTTSNLREWQKEVGLIQFNEINIEQEKVNFSNKGKIGLDENLQPTLTLDSKIIGYQDVIEFFVYTGNLKPLPASLALSAMNGMAETDPLTNEKFIEFQIKLENRNLSFGPLNILQVPIIYWPSS